MSLLKIHACIVFSLVANIISYAFQNVRIGCPLLRRIDQRRFEETYFGGCVMLRKALGLSALGFAMVSGSLMADGHDKKGYGFKIGAELRTEFTYSDNGFGEVVADDPSDSKTWSLQAAKIKMHGNVGENTDYRALLRFEDVVNGVGSNLQDAVELGHVTHHFGDMMSLRVGKDYVNYGGFERKEQNYSAIYNSPWVTSNAGSLALSQVGMGLMFNVADGHKVTVQVIKDDVDFGFAVPAGTTVPDSDAGQPAATLEWHGTFGNLEGLAQIGASRPNQIGAAVYDLGAGIKYKSGAFTGHLDYGYKMAEVNNEDLKAHRIAVHGQYDTGDFVPFLKFTLYDDISDGADDNGISVDADDNLMELAVGSHWRASGDVFRPYAAVHFQSGEWSDAANEDSPTQFNVKLGVMSQF